MSLSKNITEKSFAGKIFQTESVQPPKKVETPKTPSPFLANPLFDFGIELTRGEDPFCVVSGIINKTKENKEE